MAILQLMAVSNSTLTVFADDTDRTSYSTGSISPTAGKVLLAFVQSTIASGTGPNIPSVSGNGLTWTQIATIQETTNNTSRITVFRALATSPSAGAVTADFSGQTQTTCGMIIHQISGASTSGSNAANAIVQSATAQVSGTNTGISATLAAFGSVNNATMGFIAINRSAAITVGSGFADANTTGGGATTLQSEFRADNDTSVDATWGSAVTVGMIIAVEIRAEISSPSPSLSPSASLSPSSSISASISPSASASPSRSPSSSVSASISPSASRSPSSSLSPSASASHSISPSSSFSSSISPSPSQGYALYTRGSYVALPNDDADLTTTYSEIEVNYVETPANDRVPDDDTTLVGQPGANAYMVHQFKSFVGSNTSCGIELVAESSLPPSQSTVYLQIFNRNTGVWDTLDSNSTYPAEILFELKAKYVDLTNYKDGANLISVRIWQLAI